jgi:hypothetical protein
MCDKDEAKILFDKCKLEECKKAVRFFTDDLCTSKRQTLDILDNVPKGWSGLYKTVRAFIKESKELYKGMLFADEIETLIDNGYMNAMKGNLHSAEESNRFLLERIFLSIFIENTTNDYEKILRKRQWHRMVDAGYTILHFGEVIGRLKKTTGGKPPIDRNTIYLIGKPVCRKHLEFPEYSRNIEDFPLKERLKCKCGKEADYLTLAMPKVSALIGLGCYIVGYPSERFENIYSNISRIIHPYGLVKIDKDRAVLLWFRDYYMIVGELKKALTARSSNPSNESYQSEGRVEVKVKRKAKKRKDNPKKRNRKK